MYGNNFSVPYSPISTGPALRTGVRPNTQAVAHHLCTRVNDHGRTLQRALTSALEMIPMRPRMGRLETIMTLPRAAAILLAEVVWSEEQPSFPNRPAKTAPIATTQSQSHYFAHILLSRSQEPSRKYFIFRGNRVSLPDLFRADRLCDLRCPA